MDKYYCSFESCDFATNSEENLKDHIKKHLEEKN